PFLPDLAVRFLGVPVAPLEAGAVALRPEAGKPDARIVADATAHQLDGLAVNLDTQQLGGVIGLLVNSAPPIIMLVALAEPIAGLRLRFLGKLRVFVELSEDATAKARDLF